MNRESTRMMAAYNRWMNDRIYESLATLPDAERKKDRGAFFGSIHGTLNHLYFGDWAWMARFQDGDRPPYRIGEIIYDEFARLREARVDMDARIIAWAENLEPTWLSTPLTFRSVIDVRQRTLPAWVLVGHMFNHQTHHRGQLTTLMSQMGIDPGVTDLPWLPGLELLFAPGG